jgi:hypothetical protein
MGFVFWVQGVSKRHFGSVKSAQQKRRRPLLEDRSDVSKESVHGSDLESMGASHRRQRMKYLVDHGVESKRLSYQGYGESKPVGDNNTDEGRSMNRRTEFVIKKM